MTKADYHRSQIDILLKEKEYIKQRMEYHEKELHKCLNQLDTEKEKSLMPTNNDLVKNDHAETLIKRKNCCIIR